MIEVLEMVDTNAREREQQTLTWGVLSISSAGRRDV